MDGVNNSKWEKWKSGLVAGIFLLMLGVSNALWSSTIGISSFINQYYNVSNGSVKANMLDGVYYLFYLVFAPLSSYVKFTPGLAISIGLTFVGVVLRIVFYLPGTDGISIDEGNDTSINGASTLTKMLAGAIGGIDAVIIANAFVAAGQPFIFSFITTVSSACVPPNKQSLYVGASSMFSALGSALGYLISFYLIASGDQYAENFGNLNRVYLGLVCLLAVAMIVVGLLAFKIFINNRGIRASNSTPTTATATVMSAAMATITLSEHLAIEMQQQTIAANNLQQLQNQRQMGITIVVEDVLHAQLRQQAIIDANERKRKREREHKCVWKWSDCRSCCCKKSRTTQSGQNTQGEQGAQSENELSNRSNRSNRFVPYGLIIIYAVGNAISNIGSNYQEVILASKGFDTSTIFSLSLVSLLPGIPAPLLIGAVMDRTKWFWQLTVASFVLDAVSEIVFFYAQSAWLLYLSLLVNGIASSCMMTTFLGLITSITTIGFDDIANTNAVLPASPSVAVVVTSDDNDDSYWNGLTISSSVLLTLLLMFIPMPDSAAYQIFYATSSVALVLTTVAFVPIVKSIIRNKQ